MTITTLGLTGFEHGFIGAGAQNGGGLFDTAPGSGWSASTSSPRNGSYCARLVAPANTATKLTNNVLGAPQKIVMRFGLKVPVWPSSGTPELMELTGGIGASARLLISSAGVLSVFVGGSGTPQIGPTIDTTNWHLIEFQIDTAVAGKIDWKVDGVAQTRATGTGNGTASINLGTALNSGAAYTADYDDVIIGTWTDAGNDWYGDGKVLAQLPGSVISNLNVNHFSPGDAGTVYAAGTYGNAYQMVDDPPGTGGWTATRSTTDNIAGRSGAIATSNLAMRPVPTVEAGLANAVKAIISYSSPATQANLFACEVGSTGMGVVELWGLYNGVGKDYSETANQFKSVIVPRPAAGWTAAEVNVVYLRFGGCTSVDVSPVPTLQAWMLEVDWPVTMTGPPLDETSIDDFNRADGPIYAGAGASIWETVGGITSLPATNVKTMGNQLAGVDVGSWANSKVSLASSFDLLFDVAVSANLGVAFGVTDLGMPGFDGWWFVASGSWTLSYYTNGVVGANLASAPIGNPAAGSIIWIAKRGTTITVNYRRPDFLYYIEILRVDDARGNVASPFVIRPPNLTLRLDNLRGGPLFVGGDIIAPTINVTSVDVTKVSRVAGKDVATVQFTTDEDFIEYEIRRVSAAGDSRASGSQVETATVSARSSHSVNITDDELIAAAAVEGTNLLKVFAKDAAGNWST